MNRLSGVVEKIERAKGLSLVYVRVEEELFSSLVVDEEECGYKLQQEVDIVFKETEVMLASVASHVSARNAFVATIKQIEQGEILALLRLSFYNDEIVAVITKNALKDLECKEGKEILWFIKSNEVSLVGGV